MPEPPPFSHTPPHPAPGCSGLYAETCPPCTCRGPGLRVRTLWQPRSGPDPLNCRRGPKDRHAEAGPAPAPGPRHLPPALQQTRGALHSAMKPERKVCAPRGRRGREGARGAGVFSFQNLSTSLQSFLVGAWAPGSEPPTAAASSPSSQPPRAERDGASGRRTSPPLRGPRHPERRPPHPVPRLRGGASPRGEARRPGTLEGDTRASRGTPNTIHTALMRL